jgi:hypothetical protein
MPLLPTPVSFVVTQPFLQLLLSTFLLQLLQLQVIQASFFQFQLLAVPVISLFLDSTSIITLILTYPAVIFSCDQSPLAF